MVETSRSNRSRPSIARGLGELHSSGILELSTEMIPLSSSGRLLSETNGSGIGGDNPEMGVEMSMIRFVVGKIR